MQSLPSLEAANLWLPSISVDPQVDALYDVRADHEDFARRVLNSETIPRLRALGRRGSVRLMVTPQVITLDVEGFQASDDERGRRLEELVEAAVGLFHGAKGESRVAESPGRCLVCGRGLDAEVVACASCATAHHADCWAFNGRCATYACGSTERKVG